MGGRFCTQCGAELTAGARFCTQCGKPVGAGAPPAASAPQGPAAGAHRTAAAAMVGGSNLPWWIAGVAMFAMILVVGYFTVRKAPPTAQTDGGAAANPAAGASSVDLSKLTPIQAANMLFDRVMRDLSTGDTTTAMDFQPMAVSAYVRAEPLDLTGLLDMSLLQRLTDPTAALGTAKSILEKDPDHILGLGAAAEAEVDLGDTAQARKDYQHLLDVYDAEVVKKKPAYEAHKPLLSVMKAEAQNYLASHKK